MSAARQPDGPLIGGQPVARLPGSGNIAPADGAA
jgi:hypothetical protein